MKIRRRLAALLLIAVLAPLSLLASEPTVSSGHAVLVRSSPASLLALADPPRVIDLWFSEPLEPDFSRFELFAGDGSLVELVGMRVDPADDHHLSALTRGIDPGIYTVVYHTLSTRDGHEWSGTTTFTVLNIDGSFPTGTGFTPDLSQGSAPPEVIGRWFIFAAFAVFVGGTLVSFLAVRTGGAVLARRARRLSVRLAIVVLPLAVGGSVLQLLARQEALGGSAIDLLTDTRFGTILLWRLLALLALAAALALSMLATRRRRGSAERLFAIVAAGSALGGLVTISLLSHAAAAPGSFWAQLADVAHLLLAAAWAGGLLVTAVLLFHLRGSEAIEEPSDAAEYEEATLLPIGALVSSFSLFAIGALGLLVATGLLRTVGELPTVDAFTSTDYGEWLLIKLGLLLLPLTVALSNRAMLARWQQGVVDELELRQRLRRLLPIEAGLALTVLATVAVLGQLPTPRGDAAAAASATGAAVVLTEVNQIELVDDLTIHLQVSPATVGSNELRVHLYHLDGSDIGEVERVQLELNVGLSGRAGGDTIEPVFQGADIYTATAVVSPLAVEWSVAVDVRRAGADDARLEFRVPIQTDATELLATDRFGSPAPQLSRNFLWTLVLLPAGATMLVLSANVSRDEPPTGRGRRGSRRASRRLPRPGLRAAGTASVLVAVVLAISGSPHSDPDSGLLENPSPGDPASVARGDTLYEANCTSCHGIEGRGDGPLAFTLTPAPADLTLHVPLHSEGSTYILIANGFPNTAMPAWAETLSEEEIWDLVNFLRTEFDVE